ncbi:MULTISPECIES: helix-turn-helix domain-containing protein [Curtobacterium]|uniref:helix-turn-helix domain-containing protein n=1 Tax=Curtobacterium TaxID=2034 RepID=UPI001C92CAB8|nr:MULTISPECIES: helix-turn-helix domain-containing protein [Curtobacterium]MCE0459747.1 helix-turn-helix domain-containing protein [Curtobacterium allii]
MSELLSVEDVAERLQLRPRTIRDYIRTGRLQATRIGKQYRIRVEDLELIGRQRPTAAAPSTGSSGGEATVSATVVVRIEAADSRQEERVFTLLNVVGGTSGVALQVARIPKDGALQVVATGELAGALDVLTFISNAMEATRD